VNRGFVVVMGLVMGVGTLALVGCATAPEEGAPATSSTSAYVADPSCNPWIDPDCQRTELPPPCIGLNCETQPHQCPAMACYGTITSDCRCVPVQPPPMCYVGCEMGQHQLPDCSCVGEPWNPWNP